MNPKKRRKKTVEIELNGKVYEMILDPDLKTVVGVPNIIDGKPYVSTFTKEDLDNAKTFD